MTNKFKFFLSHLALSAILSLVIMAVVFFVWYPFPLARATGVSTIFLMLLAIDMLLGPLLGFFVYKSGKKTLKLDLAVVIVIQLSAMFYGFFNIFEGRPVWIVYNVDRFDLIRANDIETKANNYLGPKYAAIQLSQNNSQRNTDLFNEVIGGVALTQQPNRYVPLEKVKKDIEFRARKLSELKNYNINVDFNSLTRNYSEADSWVPLKANVKNMVVLVNKKQGRVVGIVDLRPWNE
ncbi:TfpX/TfpZ family type IV pilin accessory protein [Acinetobacter pollinis]|uniref:Type IV pilin accessory protein n=1 Tax=Acinetobacter pollinis TaxID=2605270 RepID=A0ABU6DSU8_9GAMM|nr:TfpX/TfpZ family type IV pilin accessory protein [Acinetobacter pollinis]MEB5476926.1 type IV pilin accessory protein [Acinetobacter pollinis]